MIRRLIILMKRPTHPETVMAVRTGWPSFFGGQWSINHSWLHTHPDGALSPQRYWQTRNKWDSMFNPLLIVEKKWGNNKWTLIMIWLIKKMNPPRGGILYSHHKEWVIRFGKMASCVTILKETYIIYIFTFGFFQNNTHDTTCAMTEGHLWEYTTSTVVAARGLRVDRHQTRGRCQFILFQAVWILP